MRMLPKYIKNTGKPWAPADDALMRQLAKQDTPTRVIALKLGRTEEAVRTRAFLLGISLKPVNQSPWNRH